MSRPPERHKSASVRWARLAAGAFLTLSCAPVAPAQEAPAPPASETGAALKGEEVNLAKELSNPIAALISVPFQMNLDGAIGPQRDGTRVTTNFQPVVPIAISPDWNMISRTVVPIVWQSNIAPGSGTQFGLADTVQSLFFSPSKPGAIIWGVGPAALIPTGGNSFLSAGKWGAGPTFVALTQSNGWTAGLLSNQIWSFAGNSSRPAVNQLYFQPFLSYSTKQATTYGVSSEGTYAWKNGQISMPVVATIGQITKIGGQLVSFTAGVKYWAAVTPNSPHGFGGRLVITLLYPRK